MNTTMNTAKTALSTIWTHKVLWFFGFFVAAGGGGGGFQASGDETMAAAGSTGALEALKAPGAESLPSWFFAVVAFAITLGLVFFVLNIVSEAALIEGIRKSQGGERPTLRSGLSGGWHHFWSLFGLKLLVGLVFGVTAATLAIAPVLAGFGLLSTGIAVAITLPLLLASIPWFLTIYFGFQWAMRFLVLQDRSVGEAVREARRFLPGRLADSLKLTLVGVLGQLGAGLTTVVALVPAALIGGGVYLVAGVFPAAITGGLLLLPVAIVAAGAGGAFRSSVWTLHFLETQKA